MENNNQQHEKIKQNVLEKIRSGEVHMHSRMYFALKMIVLILVATFALVISALVFSFIIFSIQASGRFLLLGFGTQGFLNFLILFPWGLLIIDILLLIILEQILKRFQFGYRSPLVYLISGLVVVVLAIGYFINFTPLHESLSRRADERDIPIIGGFYKHIHRPPHDRGLVRGFVTSINGNTIVLESDDRDPGTATSTFTIIVPQALISNGHINIGDYLFVAGRRDDGKIQAFGIQKISNGSIASSTSQTSIKIYYVAVGNNGKSGMPIGCGDSLVPVTVPVGSTPALLKAALQELFEGKQQFIGQSGLMNALYQSNLSVDSAVISNGIATVKLSGQVQLGGVCDDPRFVNQIKQTILQFPAITTANVFINNRTLESYGSEK
jgi:hypothetical protein